MSLENHDPFSVKLTPCLIPNAPQIEHLVAYVSPEQPSHTDGSLFAELAVLHQFRDQLALHPTLQNANFFYVKASHHYTSQRALVVHPSAPINLQGPWAVPPPGPAPTPPQRPDVDSPDAPGVLGGWGPPQGVAQRSQLWSQYRMAETAYNQSFQEWKRREAAYERWQSLQGRPHITVKVICGRRLYSTKPDALIYGTCHLFSMHDQPRNGLETFAFAPVGPQPILVTQAWSRNKKAEKNYFGVVGPDGRWF